MKKPNKTTPQTAGIGGSAAHRRSGPTTLEARTAQAEAELSAQVAEDASKERLTNIPLAHIARDPKLQPREGLKMERVEEYAEVWRDHPEKLPPIRAFYEATVGLYWVWDGWHRLKARESLGALFAPTIPALVRPGTREDAIIAASGANAGHGEPRTNADKRRAIANLLTEVTSMRDKSDREIARVCALPESSGHKLVARVVVELTDDGVLPPRGGERVVKRGDQEYTQKAKEKASGSMTQTEETQAGLFPTPPQTPRVHQVLQELEKKHPDRIGEVTIPRHQHPRSISLAIAVLHDVPCEVRGLECYGAYTLFDVSPGIGGSRIACSVRFLPKTQQAEEETNQVAAEHQVFQPPKAPDPICARCKQTKPRHVLGWVSNQLICQSCRHTEAPSDEVEKQEEAKEKDEETRGVINDWVAKEDAKKAESAEASAPKNNEGYPHWNTPEDLLALVRRVNTIALDPCSNEWSKVAATVTLTKDDDGLSSLHPWASMAMGGLIFVNPPYSNPEPWAKKAIAEAFYGAEIILLLPNDSDTEWWQDLAANAMTRCELRGRVNFLKEGKPNGKARDASVLFYFGPSAARFKAVFSKHGRISRDEPESTFPDALEALRKEDLDKRQVVFPGLEKPRESAPQLPAHIEVIPDELALAVRPEAVAEAPVEEPAEASEEEPADPRLVEALAALAGTMTTQECNGMRGALTVALPAYAAEIKAAAEMRYARITQVAKQEALAKETAKTSEEMSEEAFAAGLNELRACTTREAGEAVYERIYREEWGPEHPRFESLIKVWRKWVGTVPDKEEPNDWLARELKKFSECKTREEAEALWEKLIDKATTEAERETIGRARGEWIAKLPHAENVRSPRPSHTPNPIEPPKKKNVCEWCQKTFSGADRLQQHQDKCDWRCSAKNESGTRCRARALNHGGKCGLDQKNRDGRKGRVGK
jgi:hypothetical protein